MASLRLLTKYLNLHHNHSNHWMLCSIGQQCMFSVKQNSYQNEQRNEQSQQYLITTPIFYVNAAPHVGHLYSALLADALTRWKRIKKEGTFFTTGTDEHGLKIQQAAASSGVDPRAFCDNVSLKFKNMFSRANIECDRFVRTTESDHIKAVNAFWSRLEHDGHIYKGAYSGWYSIADESFLTEDEVEEKALPDGSRIQVSRESGHRVQWTEESNYNFRLSNFQQDILHWLKSEPIQPKLFESSVRQLIQNLPDLSVSRDSERLTWGIPVPNDPSQTIYVWLDALINYLTVAGFPDSNLQSWPPHTQIIGKDILKFHAIYWPAFLIAAKLAPPTRLIVHSHWLVENVKMSKSLGNVVDPMVKIDAVGTDGFRYFLLKEGSLASDGTYSDKRLVERINSDLANTVGNLLGRCTAASVNKQQSLPVLNTDSLFEFLTAEERSTFERLYELGDRVDTLYQALQFPKAIEIIMSQFHWANSFVQSHEPWNLAKSNDQRDHLHLDIVLHVAMETLRVCGILLQPIVPEVAGKLLDKLGTDLGRRSLDDTRKAHDDEIQIRPGKVKLYPRV